MSKPQPSKEQSSTPTVTAAAPSPASTANNNSKSKVVNPYAKKKSTVSVSADVAPKMTTNITNNPYLNKNKQSRDHTPSPPKKKNPPPVDEFTTFSQAFGSPDANHIGEDRFEEQFAFDYEEMGSTSGINNNINNESNTNNVTKTTPNNNNNGITARDHHTLLSQDNVLHISTRQRGNPIIAHIRNVPFKYSTMVPDYILAPTRCALFLSLRYHNLHPNYIHRRIAELGSDFTYRMILCHVDIEDNASAILFLNDLCCQNSFTLILAWSEEEAARYLETVKVFNNKDPSSIIGKKDIDANDHTGQVAFALKGSIGINKTDASQLLTQFGSWKAMSQASLEELSICPGIGVKKVRRLHDAFHRPFSREFSKRRKERESEKHNKNAKEGPKKNVNAEAKGDKKEAVPTKK